MENATKALLIAAAILVAIIIISIGIAVVQQGQNAVSNADLSEAEMAAFNSKFKNYEGTNVSTATVHSLLTTVLTHNQNQTKNKTTNYVEVVNSSETMLSTGAANITRVTGSDYYNVVCNYTNGLVTSIKVTNTSKKVDV